MDCTTVTNVEIPPGSDDQLVACACALGYTWAPQPTLLCVADCASDQNSPGTVDGNGRCDCDQNFEFNDAEAKCKINCGTVPNSNLTIPGTVDTCPCITQYTWNTSTFSCDLNCAGVPHTVNSTVDPAGPQCYCIDKYTWDVDTSTCKLSCNDIVNTNNIRNPLVENDTFCVCSTNFLWNLTTLQCDYDCTVSFNTNSSVPGNMEMCVCNVPYDWNVATK